MHAIALGRADSRRSALASRPVSSSSTGYLQPGQTIAVLGSSGVGKSTLINRLLGEDRLRTSEVRERRSARPAHHDASRAGPAARRRAADRHAGHARTAAVVGRRRRGRDVRRHRGPRPGLPLRRLRARARAAVCGETGRGRGPPGGRRASRAFTSCRKSCPHWPSGRMPWRSRPRRRSCARCFARSGSRSIRKGTVTVRCTGRAALPYN